MIRRYRNFSPKIHKKAYVDDSAIVIGDVEIGENSSVWPGVVIRGDRDKISIGRYTNIQDNATIHNTKGFPVYIGNYVSIGHRCLVHGSKIASESLIGMGAILLNGSEIGENSLVGAGALITEGKKIPPRSLALGFPAKVVRELSEEEIRFFKKNAKSYYNLMREYKLR